MTFLSLSYIPSGWIPPHLHRLGDGLHRVGVEPPAAAARALHHEHRRLVEQPVEGAEERVVVREELVPSALSNWSRASEIPYSGTLFFQLPYDKKY